MLSHRLFRSKALVVGLLGGFVFLLAPPWDLAAAVTAEKAKGQNTLGTAALQPSGALVGFIYGKDMTTPVPNAVVKLRNITSQKDYASKPTDANGMYKITGIEEGRYILGVTDADGSYNFYYALLLKGNEMAKLSLAMNPAHPSGSGGDEGGGGAGSFLGFFKSPLGIMTIVVAASAVLYATVLVKKEEASPIR